MPIYINGALAGMGDAVYDKDYQKSLSEKMHTSALQKKLRLILR